MLNCDLALFFIHLFCFVSVVLTWCFYVTKIVTYRVPHACLELIVFPLKHGLLSHSTKSHWSLKYPDYSRCVIMEIPYGNVSRETENSWQTPDFQGPVFVQIQTSKLWVRKHRWCLRPCLYLNKFPEYPDQINPAKPNWLQNRKSVSSYHLLNPWCQSTVYYIIPNNWN